MVAPSSYPFRIAEVPGKGLGVIATRPISRGSLVLEEKPLLLVDSTMDESALAAAVAAVAALSESSRTAFMSLHNAHPADSEPYSGIVKSNALTHEGGTEVSSGGIYLIGCRFNHSCRPNALSHFDAVRGVMVFQAVHPISKGEEITHYYTFLLNSSRERREDLLAKFGFECACEVCALPAKEVEASDKRRAAVKAALEAIPGLLSSPLRIVLKVRQALRDLEREGLETGKAALAYDVFQAALLYSDEASARKWAEFMIECHVVADGPDSTKCVEARKEAAGLRKDPRFGKYGRKMVGGPD